MKNFLGKNCHHMVSQADWPSYYVSDLQSWLVGKNIICLKWESPHPTRLLTGSDEKRHVLSRVLYKPGKVPLVPTLCCNCIMIWGAQGVGLPLSASHSTTVLVISGGWKRILSTGLLHPIFPTALEPGSVGPGFGLIVGEGSLPGL